ncbi:hypothetical protein L0U95_08170 [Burkholderia cenocepacia]|nr:hypothetical protein L0U95_08170 [Burkholderia cenocepacia]
MLAEVRPDGFTMLDTYRLAFADGLFAVRDGVEIRVAQGDGIGAQLLRAQLGDDGALRLVAYNHRAAPADQRRALLAALAAAFSDSAHHVAIRLDPAAWPAVALDALRASGVLADGGRCLRDGWAQQADLWRVGPLCRARCCRRSPTAGVIRAGRPHRAATSMRATCRRSACASRCAAGNRRRMPSGSRAGSTSRACATAGRARSPPNAARKARRKPIRT